MFFLLLILVALITACTTPQTENPRANDILTYDRPATIWEETLPLGNGRLGLMPDGGIEQEHIVLNEISVWAGSEADYGNADAWKNLDKIRALLSAGKNIEAQELMYKSFVPKSTSGDTYGSYQMLGDLDIRTCNITSEVTNYRRWLDMRSGVATTEFTLPDGSHIKREYFASRHDAAIIIKYSSDGAPLDLEAAFSRAKDACTRMSSFGRYELKGTLPSGQEGVGGVSFAALANCLTDSGATAVVDSAGWHVKNAREVTFIVTAATTYIYGNEYGGYAHLTLDLASKRAYNALKANHITVHSELYDRVQIDHAGTSDTLLKNDRRIVKFPQTIETTMAVLYYNYGRYSLISSTRQGTLPPNLQGLWANECGTPWNGDYHANINVQMNHWPLEQGNLDELYEPLIALVERSVGSGEQTAKTFYGPKARGWVMHMMTNVWNFTAPGEHPSWGATNTGGAWLCAHLWERYEYTLDTLYLRRIYPTLKGAAEFFASTMVREPKHGWLVTSPTSSPENEFYISGSRTPVSVCMGPTMDTQIIRELYTNVVKAAEILGVDSQFAATLRANIDLLPPMQIAPEGYLQEWLEDYEEVDVHHRHVSHLYGLHPSNQISPLRTPELAEACRQTLDRRGDEGTGWSRAWKINFWARLHDGNRALKLLASLLQPAVDSVTGAHGSGTFPNLWCSHPPFQLDGNFGGAAGIGEMLLQSHMGYIEPLPALPTTWTEGSVSGMKGRGGAEISFAWKARRLRTLTLEGGKSREYTIANPDSVRIRSVVIAGEQSEVNFENEDGMCFMHVQTSGERIEIGFE